MIGGYFSDIALNNCNICDNCIDSKPGFLSAEEFKMISRNIAEVLSAQKLSREKLYEKIDPVAKDKFGKVFNYMLAESKLRVDKNGDILLTN